MSLGNRIKELRVSKGFTQEDLADKLGTSKQAIYKYEAGIVTNIPLSSLEIIAKELGVTPAYLVGWEPDSPYPDNIIPVPGTKRVPLLGTIACGNPITAIENPDDYILMPDNVHADFALRCKGDSMIGARILDGDIVYIRQQEDVDNGDIAAVIIGDEATLKRVYKESERDRLTLMAENPAYPPLVYQGVELEQIRILGKAVAFLSKVE